ncbi:MAG: DAK2 domain-containing protein [Candidatus Bipolaricaulis sp.]|nr:DAK2 domain-containing protein [Candidatus Bipolaricaulis sp.]
MSRPRGVRGEARLATISGPCVREAMERAIRHLAEHEELINALNVFPVPDGDTGTNMVLTVQSAVEGLRELGDASLGKTLEVMASRALLGARGNSGVILAQYLVGLSQAVDSHRASWQTWAEALARATDEAYRAVAEPKEGTILTLMRAVAEEAKRLKGKPLPAAALALLSRANEALAQTREMLPELAEAGVVDSGGLGYLFVLRGFVEQVVGETEMAESLQALLEENRKRMEAYTAARREPAPDAPALRDTPSTRFCLQFILKGEDLPLGEIRERLSRETASVVVVGGPTMAHVHVHTNDPDSALGIGAAYGEVGRVKLDDIHRQYHDFVFGTKGEVTGPVALIPVVNGEGLAEIARGLGATEVIVADKMNPAVGELLEAIGRVPQAQVVILPNDENVILVAQHAAKLSEKEVRVVPTTTIPQGLVALLAAEGDLASTVAKMEGAMRRVRTGEVTYAIRRTNVNGLPVEAGEYLAIWDSSPTSTGTTPEEALLRSLPRVVGQESLLTLLYGREVTNAQAMGLADAIRGQFPNLEVQIYYGGQPYHHYIVALE